MGAFRFGKQERLSKNKVIEQLFAKGSSRLAFPVKIVFIRQPDKEQSLHQVLITVPAKNFKKAVDRNKLKRRIREGYRLNKALLPPAPTLCIAYIYVAKEILPSATIHQAIRASMKELSDHYEKKS
jgi:ribonuclease P protein component